MKIAVLPGDGIGPEIMAQAVRVIKALESDGSKFEMEEGPVGGAGYDAAGDPLPAGTLDICRKADAVLFGAVGGPQYDTLPRAKRPEQGLLKLRKELGLFANLRPAVLYPELAEASALRPEVVAGLDIMILRELTGDIYFGQPRGRRQTDSGEREGFDTMKYAESEIRRIARVGFEIALKRGRKLCSVDKANVLDTSILWREVVSEVAKEYPQVTLTHMYVDNAAMQLVRAPKQFDVIVTGNMFGDILSDQLAGLVGGLGMAPGANIGPDAAIFEAVHGSAPDIAGKGIANPLALLLAVGLMLEHIDQPDLANRLRTAIDQVLRKDGVRTPDLDGKASTSDFTQSIIRRLGQLETGRAVRA